MMYCKLYISLFVCSVLALCFTQAQAGPFDEIRICGEPARTASGKIARSAKVLSEFQKLHPCPSTGATSGACPGWAIDHVIPLACGGCDAVSNLQWMPNILKSCAGNCKDRWERKINCAPAQIVVVP